MAIYIVKTGSALAAVKQRHGDFEEWIARGLKQGTATEVITLEAQALPDYRQLSPVDGVVVTGSAAMVSDRLDWSEALAEWLRDCVARQWPVLGICYGHQLLCHALGGEAGYHPQGMEIGSHSIQLLPAAAEDPLFSAFPKTFTANLVHRQSARVLPKQAVLLASNAFEPHQAFRVGACAWGVQFHPEFSGTIMAEYIQHFYQELQQNQRDPDALLAKVSDAPEAQAILPAFARFCDNWSLKAGAVE